MSKPAIAACAILFTTGAYSSHFDMFALVEQVARARDQGLGSLDSVEDFDFLAHVFADGDGHKVDGVAGIDGDHMHSAVIDHQGAGGHEERGALLGQRELYLGIHAGQQGSVAVIDLHLGEHGAGGVVERRRIANYRPGVGPPQTLPYIDRSLLAVFDVDCLGLRNVDLDAQRAALGNAEQRLGRARVARADQVAAFYVALGDHSVKGGDDALEALHLLEARYVGPVGGDVGFGGGDVGIRRCHVGYAGVVGLHCSVYDLLRDGPLLA